MSECSIIQLLQGQGDFCYVHPIAKYNGPIHLIVLSAVFAFNADQLLNVKNPPNAVHTMVGSANQAGTLYCFDFITTGLVMIRSSVSIASIN